MHLWAAFQKADCSLASRMPLVLSDGACVYSQVHQIDIVVEDARIYY